MLREFDQVCVRRCLVNCGPDPSAAVDYVRRHAAMTLRGNHDHAVAFGEDPGCSARRGRTRINTPERFVEEESFHVPSNLKRTAQGERPRSFIVAQESSVAPWTTVRRTPLLLQEYQHRWALMKSVASIATARAMRYI